MPAAEVPVRVSLGLGELFVVDGLGAERDRDHPVPAAVFVDRQDSSSERSSDSSGDGTSRASRTEWRWARDDWNVNSSNSRLSAK